MSFWKYWKDTVGKVRQVSTTMVMSEEEGDSCSNVGNFALELFLHDNSDS